MEIVEATMGEGGVLHVEGLPLAAGSPVTVEFFAEPTSQEAWCTFLDRHYGVLAATDFDVPRSPESKGRRIGLSPKDEDRPKTPIRSPSIS